MAWNWYAIKEVDEIMLKNTPDQTFTFDLGAGEETIRFIKGFSLGIIFRNYLLFPNLNGQNPFNANNSVGAFIKDGKYWLGVNQESN
jgi:hypothetical protein